LIKTGVLHYYSISGILEQIDIEPGTRKNTVSNENAEDPWKL